MEAPSPEVTWPGRETEQAPHRCQMSGNIPPIPHVLSWCEDGLLKDCLHACIKVLLQIIHCICNTVYKQNFDTLHTYYRGQVA
jgi:hypothetical protein